MDDDFYESLVPQCPSADGGDVVRGGRTLGFFTLVALVAFIGFACLMVTRGGEALAHASSGVPASLVAAHKVAHRWRAMALAISAVGIAVAIVSPWSLLVVFWLPLVGLPIAWRAHRALSGDAATIHDRYVHIWRDGKLRAWLRVDPTTLAELAVPAARARR